MFEKFTGRSRKVMSLARKAAQDLGSDFIGTEHVLLGMIEEGDGVAAKVLENLGTDAAGVRREVKKGLAAPKGAPVHAAQLPFSPHAKTLIERAAEASDRLGHHVIGTEHLLLGLAQMEEGTAVQLLHHLGLDTEKIRGSVLEIVGARTWAQPLPAKTEIALQERDLSVLDPQDPSRWGLVTRTSATDVLLKFLKDGKSIALIGPKWVGKTSILFSMAREKMGGFRYRCVDYRIFDPFATGFTLPPWDGYVARVLPDGRLLAASDRNVFEVLLKMSRGLGDRLVVEFREEEFEAFASRYPALYRELTPVKIAPPEKEEARRLLESAVQILVDRSGYAVSGEVLNEADRLAAEALPDGIPPWRTLLVLWKAVRSERESRLPPEIAEVGRRIEELEELKKEAVESRRFDEASGYRGQIVALKARRSDLLREQPPNPDPRITTDALRAAIDSLKGRA